MLVQRTEKELRSTESRTELQTAAAAAVVAAAAEVAKRSRSERNAECYA